MEGFISRRFHGFRISRWRRRHLGNGEKIYLEVIFKGRRREIYLGTEEAGFPASKAQRSEDANIRTLRRPTTAS